MAMVQAREHPSYKSITSIPGWAESLAGATDKISNTAGAYALVPLVYRCLQLRCDSVASVPVKVFRGKGDGAKEIPWPWPAVNPKDLIWRTEAALLMSGAAYWYKPVNQVGRMFGPRWLNPVTMRVEYTRRVIRKNDKDVEVDQILFKQSVGTGPDAREWTYDLDEIVYFREFHPLDDIGPGISAVSVALNDAGLTRYISRFAAYFFEGGAMPALLLGIPPQTSDAERERTENYFRRMLGGVKHAFRVLAIKAGLIDPKVISFPLKDLAMPELSEQARKNIALAFKIPQTMLEDAANRATAEQHDAQWWESTVRPRAEMIEAIINAQLFEPVGLSCKLAIEELDVFQEDETQRVTSINGYMDILTKCPTYAIFQTFTRDMGCEWSEDTLKAVKDWYAQKEEKAEAMAESLQDANATPPQNEPAANEDEQPEQPPAPLRAEMTNELRAALVSYKHKALHAVERGHSANVQFDTAIIPGAMLGAMSLGLRECKSKGDVVSLFDDLLPPDPAEQLKRACDALEAIGG
jgi:HK97 family phage portal protein